MGNCPVAYCLNNSPSPRAPHTRNLNPRVKPITAQARCE